MKRTGIQIILILLCAHTNAQNAFTNSGNLQIHTGVSVSVFENFTNTSSGILVNNGNLYVKGTITNDQSSMTVGTGILYLNGSTTQNLNGTQSFNTRHLVTSNSAGISLNNNLSVSGTHTFNAGVITTSSTPNYLIYEAGSGYTGNGDNTHVNGWVKKRGTTNFVFPIGNGTVERTIALNSLSVNSEFNAKYFASTPYYTQLQSPPIYNIDPAEYWSISKVSGGSATVGMNWDYSKVWFPNWIVADILVAGYNGSLWTDNGGKGTASGTTTTTGTISSNSISSFNLFVFGASSYILPLTLVNFTAYRQNNYTQIDWATEREYNMDHFVVERSDDGSSFYAINQAQARNTNNTEQYYCRDHATVQLIAYYRLRSVDVNGREYLSRTVTVTVAGNNQLTLLINPVKDKITLVAAGTLNGLFNYTITAMNGQLTQLGKLMVQNGGSYQLQLNGNIHPGTYLLEVSNGLESFRFKLVVQ